MLTRIDRLTALPADLDFGLNVVQAGAVIIASVISKLWIIATFPRLDECPFENHSPNTLF